MPPGEPVKPQLPDVAASGATICCAMVDKKLTKGQLAKIAAGERMFAEVNSKYNNDPQGIFLKYNPAIWTPTTYFNLAFKIWFERFECENKLGKYKKYR